MENNISFPIIIADNHPETFNSQNIQKPHKNPHLKCILHKQSKPKKVENKTKNGNIDFPRKIVRMKTV
jgi:hypothetical protein